MSSSRYVSHASCNNHPRTKWHRIDGGMCEDCFQVQCLCGKWNKVLPFGTMRCSGCREEIELSQKTRRAMTHPPDLIICPLPGCGRKLRLSPRDKRRSLGLKTIKVLS